jgi:dolichol-phosphate mannosyltransferase
MPLLSVVVPVYKEQDNIRPFLTRLVPVLESIGTYEILFCLDPSPDRTEQVIEEEIQHNENIFLMVFSRRFGQPSATMAGILECQGDYCVVIDVDLQDPPELIADLYAKAQEGFDVVAAQRVSRDGETLLKKAVSYLGYKVINKIAHVSIPTNTGDFRIMSRRVIEGLRQHPESHCFLRGLVSLVGYKQTTLPYKREARLQGAGHYNRFLGSLKIGFNGIIGFSSYPLSLLLFSGCFLAFLSLIGIGYLLTSKFVFHNNYPIGIPTAIVSILFMGGIQLISIGLLGEYVGRIYDEVKRRPRYIVDRVVSRKAAELRMEREVLR